MKDVYNIQPENILHETIEGEVVIVHLEKGTYYSLDGVGAAIWEKLSQGASQEALTALVQAGYEGDRDRIATEVGEFLQQLLSEGLVFPVEVEEEAAEISAPPGKSAGKPYATPALNIHTDMEQLLLVDPIHEVEDSGWPNVK